LALRSAGNAARRVQAQEFASQAASIDHSLLVSAAVLTSMPDLSSAPAEAASCQPTIVLQNVSGAGSISGANQFHDKAKPDGLTLLTVSASTLLN